MDSDLITLSDAARRIGINKSTISRQIKAGLLRSHGGKVRLTELLEDRARNLDPARVRTMVRMVRNRRPT